MDTIGDFPGIFNFSEPIFLAPLTRNNLSGHCKWWFLLHQPLLLPKPNFPLHPNTARTTSLWMDYRGSLVCSDHHWPVRPPHPRAAILGRVARASGPSPRRDVNWRAR
jgi:hypothetical protein